MRRGLRRLAGIVAVGAFHLAVYVAVNRWNGSRPASALRDLTTPVDRWVPHLPWSWPAYWALYPFLTAGAGAVVWRLEGPAFRRALLAYGGASLVGGAVQVALPAEGPWPEEWTGAQALLHGQPLAFRHACFPSMHVAFSVLTAALAPAVFRGGGIRALYVATAGAITASTVTLREHYALDAAGGVALGLAAERWWRRDGRPDHGRGGVLDPEPESHHTREIQGIQGEEG